MAEMGLGGWSAKAQSSVGKGDLPVIRSYKLFVDDMREIPEGWLGCRTVSEAIAVLANLPISEVSLDHDIIAARSNGSLYQALAQETFKGVAYYIAAMPTEHKPIVRIHTANSGAAMTMCGILNLPFSTTYVPYHPNNYKEIPNE